MNDHSINRLDIRWYYTVFAVFIGTLLNSLLQLFIEDHLHLPFYFDSIFTIFVGVFFGWLPGLATGLFTNLFIEVLDGFKGLAWPFAAVNMATGVVAGLMAADKEKYWTLVRQLTMVFLLTAVNTLLGAFIVNIVYGGLTGTPADVLVSALLLMGRSKTLSSILGRIPTNLVDKGLPVLILYVIYRVFWYRKIPPDSPNWP